MFSNDFCHCDFYFTCFTVFGRCAPIEILPSEASYRCKVPGVDILLVRTRPQRMCTRYKVSPAVQCLRLRYIVSPVMIKSPPLQIYHSTELNESMTVRV